VLSALSFAASLRSHALRCAIVLLAAMPDGYGREPEQWWLQFSPYTKHFASSPEQRPGVWMIGVERESASGGLAGAVLFRNSFAQPSAYFYPWGARYKGLFGVEPLFLKWSAGVLYGYKAPYEDKVPLNVDGFSPAVIPALGWQLGPRISAQANLLGTAGIMFQISADLPP